MEAPVSPPVRCPPPPRPACQLREGRDAKAGPGGGTRRRGPGRGARPEAGAQVSYGPAPSTPPAGPSAPGSALAAPAPRCSSALAAQPRPCRVPAPSGFRDRGGAGHRFCSPNPWPLACWYRRGREAAPGRGQPCARAPRPHAAGSGPGGLGRGRAELPQPRTPSPSPACSSHPFPRLFGGDPRAWSGKPGSSSGYLQ